MSKRKNKEVIIDEEDIPAEELEWLEHAERIKAAIPTIDPKTAEIACCHQMPDDPYGSLRGYGYPTWKDIEVPVYYAHTPAPESNDNPFSEYGKCMATKVWFGDLPETERNALVEKRKAQLQEAALAIDPETAEVGWDYVIAGDPYCFTATDPTADGIGTIAGSQKLERDYFAWAPGGDERDPDTNLSVWFGDLPEAVHKALWKKHDLPGNGKFKEKG